MDENHILTDVFEVALDILKSDRKSGHTAQEVTAALAKAEKIVAKNAADLVEGTARAKRRSLVKMLEDWDKTRKPVPTRWAATDPLAWKA